MLLQAYLPDLNESLGIFIPLIVVNCIILGRAEAYASKNPVIPSLFDGIGMGLGFTIALTTIGIFRELLGNGSIFGWHLLPSGYVPITIFIMAPGAFFVLAMLTALQNKLKAPSATNNKPADEIACVGGSCAANHRVLDEAAAAEKAAKAEAAKKAAAAKAEAAKKAAAEKAAAEAAKKDAEASADGKEEA